MRSVRFLPAVLLLVLALVVAGCGGGGSQSVPSDAVAVVGGDTITKAQFNNLLGEAQAAYKARKTPFPKAGTTQYKQLQDQAIAYLVQQSELEQKGKDIGVSVSDTAVQSRLKSIKQQFCAGNDKEYRKQLAAQGLTEPQLLLAIRNQVLSDDLFTKVTKSVTVPAAAIAAYYQKNQSAYGTAASRDVRHILVKSKKQAEGIEAQLKNGGDFAKLAKKYSTDTASAANGGKLTITKGQTVPQFDKVAFALKTNQISPPVHTTYGWHIIQALSAITPAKVTPLKQVQGQIKAQLLSTKKSNTMKTWLAGVKKDFAKKVSYQTGYAPASTSTSSTSTSQ